MGFTFHSFTSVTVSIELCRKAVDHYYLHKKCFLHLGEEAYFSSQNSSTFLFLFIYPNPTSSAGHGDMICLSPHSDKTGASQGHSHTPCSCLSCRLCRPHAAWTTPLSVPLPSSLCTALQKLSRQPPARSQGWQEI